MNVRALSTPMALRLELLGLYVASVAFVSFQLHGHSNNFTIYRESFRHLIAGQDLYAAYPEYWDLFKYPPTFAFLFAPFAVLPYGVALFCWDLLAALVFFSALDRLLPERQAPLGLSLAFFQVVTAMQLRNSANTLLAGLIILAFVALEHSRQLRAALLIGLGTSVKILPLAALPLAVFYPRRARFALLFLAVAAGLVALPLAAVSYQELAAQYRSWRAVLAVDAIQHGYSVMGQLQICGVDLPNLPVQLAGTAILLLPLALRRASWGDPDFRRTLLCSILVYVVVFNHQAEHPSYVIAYTGIVIWYVTSPRTPFRTWLMAFTFAVLVVLHSDLIPSWMRRDIFYPYAVLTIPCLVAWLVMQVELFGARSWVGSPELRAQP